VPFATSKDRTDELPSAVVAMDAVTAMHGHRELAIPPAFVNVIRNCPGYASPTWQTSEKVRKEAFQLDARNSKK
jgi:hypothetical protein